MYILIGIPKANAYNYILLTLYHESMGIKRDLRPP